MKRIPIICTFRSIENLFNFGKYDGLSLADVLDIEPSYVNWCVKYCTYVIFQLEDIVIEEIKVAYPHFIMDVLFESKRVWQLNRNAYEESYDYDCDDNDYDNLNDDYPPYDESNYYLDYEAPHTFEKYSGSWAQDIEGYSDDEIDTIFDGDPSAYWNID